MKTTHLRLVHLSLRSCLCALVIVALSSFAVAPAVHAASDDDTPEGAAGHFAQAHPRARIARTSRGIGRIYGSAFEHGNSPEDTAQRFVQKRSQMFSVPPHELRPGAGVGHLRHTQQVMPDRENGGYKFTLVVYSQFKDDLPVFRSDLRMLVRNDVDSPMVLAASSLRDLRGFSVSGQLRADLARPAFVQRRFGAAQQAARARVPSLVNFHEPEAVVWAGTDSAAEPVAGLKFLADNQGVANVVRPESWLFIADARSGQLVYEEYLIHDTNVGGNISAIASDGPGADFCEPEISMPMAYARAEIGSSFAFANSAGSYVIANGGSTQVTVDSPMVGQRFSVIDSAGPEEDLSLAVVPPGPANFVHNAANSSEFVRAQTNAYIEANRVRDWIVAANPSYPLIGNQTGFPIYVNRIDNFCPGNAWYDGIPDTINFCRAAAGYPNTAWSSVVHHEFGHHLVSAGGSGQGQYGEGMGDVLSTIILDDNRMGIGFWGSCSTWLRDADNNHQYPCSAAIHDCGQLISGCVWDTRNQLVLTEPGNYQQILMDLAVNSVLLHSGTEITPQITTDWLTLDDDDGDLSNGTPHSAEIEAGFGAHNMVPPPPPLNDTCATAVPLCPGSNESGSTVSADSDGASSCGSSSSSPDAWYTYEPATSGTATFSLCNAGSNYDTVLSVHSGCPGAVSNTLSCDDDACGSGGSSEVTLAVTAGQTYIVRVTGWNGSAGNFEVGVTGPDCAGGGCSSDLECRDSDACNGAETCNAGVCQPGTPITCDDGDACNGSESCVSGSCVSGTPLNCDDGNSCTSDSCANDACVNNPVTPCCGDLTCDAGEDCNTCASDCVGQGSVAPGCGNGVCEVGLGEDCLSCSADCRGKQNGKPSNRYCCGDGDGENPVGCNDSRCNASGFQCGGTAPAGYCCGDFVCEGDEDGFNCELDCGACVPDQSTETSCSDGNDNDCDIFVDCNDSDCDAAPACSCLTSGGSCSVNSDCCGNKCKGGSCRGN
jgi:hypothetical protein